MNTCVTFPAKNLEISLYPFKEEKHGGRFQTQQKFKIINQGDILIKLLGEANYETETSSFIMREEEAQPVQAFYFQKNVSFVIKDNKYNKRKPKALDNARKQETGTARNFQ